MKTVIAWLNSALATKDIGAGMTHYRVKGGNISATNGQITASHPWTFGKDEFLVPGMEFEKLLDRMADTPTLSVNNEGELIMKSGRFVLDRADELKDWSWNENHVAFRWGTKAWMRSQLILGQFPEKAATMVRDSAKAKTTQKIDDAFRAAIVRVGELAEGGPVSIYANKVEARMPKALVEDATIKCEIPKDAKCSIFGGKYLLPVIAVADSWSPSMWPAPVPFRGKVISGYIAGIRQR